MLTAEQIKRLGDYPVVQLQLLDAITGEPLEYVNPVGIAGKIYMLNGTDLETLLTDVVRQLQTANSQLTKDNGDFLKHIHNESNLGKVLQTAFELEDDDPLVVNGEGVHAVKEKLDKALIDIKVNKDTGVVTFTQYDGKEVIWDTALEHVPVDMGWDDDTARFFLKKDSGEIQWIDFARLVDIYIGRTGTGTIDTEVVMNQIRASVRKGSIDIDHLTLAVKNYLTESERFIKAYEEKIKGIEEGANRYVLPPAKSVDYEAPKPLLPSQSEEGTEEAGENAEEPATDDTIDERLGGVIVGKNMAIDEEGVLTAANILYGTDIDSAKPVSIFMQVVNSTAPSTSPTPEVKARNSYITTEGNIIIGKDDGRFDYIIASYDGTRQSNLTIDEVNAKMFSGLELLDLSDISWYNDGTYNYAINSAGEGFKYSKNDYVFVDYVTNEEFLALIKSMKYEHGRTADMPELRE